MSHTMKENNFKDQYIPRSNSNGKATGAFVLLIASYLKIELDAIALPTQSKERVDPLCQDISGYG